MKITWRNVFFLSAMWCALALAGWTFFNGQQATAASSEETLIEYSAQVNFSEVDGERVGEIVFQPPRLIR